MKRSLFILNLTLSLLLFSGTTLKIYSQVVPPDLGKDTTIILVEETERDKVNEEFEEVFSENYGGQFALVPVNSFSQKKYSDTKKYRYVFQTSIRFIPATGSGNTRMPATYEYTYKIYDRETGKFYGFDYGSDSWKKLLKKYVAKIEEQRKVNQK